MVDTYKRVAIIDFRMDARKYRETMSKLRKQTAQDEKDLKRAAGSFAVLAASAAALTSVYREFELGMKEVEKNSNLNRKSLDLLGASMRNMSKATGASRAELIGIAADAVKLGVDGVDNILEFTATVSQLTIATDLTAESSATLLARILSLANLPIARVRDLGNVIVAMGSQLATGETAIVDVAGELTAGLTAMGLRIDTILGVSAALAATGVSAANGATALNKALGALKRAAREGGLELENWAEIADVSIGEMRRLIEDDLDQALERVLIGLGERGGEIQVMLERVGLVDERTNRALITLAKGGEVTARALRIANAEIANGTRLTDEFAVAQSGSVAKLERFRALLSDIALAASAEIVPTLANYAANTESAADATDRLGSNIGKAIKIALGFAAAWTAIAAVRTLMGRYSLAISSARRVTAKATGGLKAFGRVATLLRAAWVFSPAGLLAVLGLLLVKTGQVVRDIATLDREAEGLGGAVVRGLDRIKITNLELKIKSLDYAIADLKKNIGAGLFPDPLYAEKELDKLLARMTTAKAELATLQPVEVLTPQEVVAQRAPEAPRVVRAQSLPDLPPSPELIALRQKLAGMDEQQIALIKRRNELTVESQKNTTALAAEESEVTKQRLRQERAVIAAKLEIVAQDQQRLAAAREAAQTLEEEGVQAEVTQKLKEKNAEEEALARARYDYETQLELQRLYHGGAEEAVIAHYRREREIEAEQRELELEEETAAWAVKNERLKTARLKLTNDEKTAAQKRLETDKKNMAALTKSNLNALMTMTGNAKWASNLLDSINRLNALNALVTKAPSQAAGAFGLAMETIPPPLGQIVGLASAAAVYAQYAASIVGGGAAVVDVPPVQSGGKTGTAPTPNPHMARGGIVPGMSLRDNTLILATPGETVVPKQSYADVEAGILARYEAENGDGDGREIKVEIEMTKDAATIFRARVAADNELGL